MKILYYIIGIIIGSILGALEGLYLGALIGGNFLQDIYIFGKRGYEATAYIGLFIGLPLGCLLGILLVRFMLKKKTESK